AYGAALAIKWFAAPMAVALLIAPLAAAFGALVFGWFSVRLSGVYLAMLTLAFAQIVWSIVFQWQDFTRGFDWIFCFFAQPALRPAFRLFSAHAELSDRGSAAATPHSVRALRLRHALWPRLAIARRSDRHRRKTGALVGLCHSRHAVWPGGRDFCLRERFD